MDSKSLDTAMQVLASFIGRQAPLANDLSKQVRITFATDLATVYHAIACELYQRRKDEQYDEECRTASAYHQALRSESYDDSHDDE